MQGCGYCKPKKVIQNLTLGGKRDRQLRQQPALPLGCIVAVRQHHTRLSGLSGRSMPAKQRIDEVEAHFLSDARPTLNQGLASAFVHGTTKTEQARQLCVSAAELSTAS